MLEVIITAPVQIVRTNRIFSCAPNGRNLNSLQMLFDQFIVIFNKHLSI